MAKANMRMKSRTHVKKKSPFFDVEREEVHVKGKKRSVKRAKRDSAEFSIGEGNKF